MKVYITAHQWNDVVTKERVVWSDVYMMVFLGFLCGGILGIILGLAMHRDELKEINDAHKFTCMRYESTIRNLKSKLSELNGMEGNPDERKDIYRDSSNDWW